MSRPSIREVEYPDANGKMIKTVTDSVTAREIGEYIDTYNKIKSFDVMSYTISTNQNILNTKFDCSTLIARSPRIQIMCIKEYVAGMPEFMNGARYACKITNVKSGQYKTLDGGVAALYYNLFHRHAR